MKTLTHATNWESWLRGILIAFLFVPAIAYAQTNWVKHGAAVLDPGAPGTWDDQLVAPGTVIFQDTIYKMWYCGYDGTNMRVGYATSPDGITWTKSANPVLDLGASGSWESKWVGIPMVHVSDTLYRMWYMGDDGTYERGGYATSTDGINWTKDSHNPVLNLGSPGSWDDLCAGPGPTIYDTAFKMIYSGFEDGSTCRAGYATSPDGIQWTKATSPVINLGTWDNPRVQPNSIVYEARNSKYLLFYGGGAIFTWRIGFASAADVQGPWSKTGKVMDVTAGTWESRYVGFPSVLYDTTSKQYKMWYLGGSAEWAGKIGYATANPNPIRVPADYPTIQEAIDIANNGDRVVVAEGTYYENIRFRGKKITVGSQYVLDGDTSHISKTIIDGSHSTNADSGSVVYFTNGEDTTSVLSGFTIRGGRGTKYNLHSSWFNYVMTGGGGIFCNNAGASIKNNNITQNRIAASAAYGGGIGASADGTAMPWIVIEGNRIAENSVEATSTITNQWGGGGGICILGLNARVVQNLLQQDTAIGYMGACGAGMVVEAYTTGQWPTGTIAGNIFRSNICKSGAEGSVGAGLCLTWTGGYTINDNIFEGNVATSSGTSSGWASGGALLISDQDISGYGRKTLVKNQFVHNWVSSARLNVGGAVLMFKTLCTLSGNEIKSNSVIGSGAGGYETPGGGGGICFQFTSFRFENNIVTQNMSVSDGGGVLVTNLPQSGTEQVLMNNTIVNNHSDGPGAGMRVYNATKVVSANNIFWNDSAGIGADEIAVTGSILGVVNCDVAGGYTGTGNIDADPKFVVGDTMFNLQATSSCIGTGVDSIWLGSTWYYAPTCDCDGHLRPQPTGKQHSDIGAQEEQVTTDVGSQSPVLPKQFVLGQNYPNPFNPATAINYQLPLTTHVSLKVFDLLGREVVTLVDETKYAGSYKVNWDASRLSSGVYFYRLQAGKFVETKRMILMK